MVGMEVYLIDELNEVSTPYPLEAVRVKDGRMIPVKSWMGL